MIIKKWEEVHSHVGEESYCMDFAYLEKSDKVVVIEISPFLQCTGKFNKIKILGPALFSWEDKELRSILENGPFEFRLNEKLHPHINDLIEINWEYRWKSKVLTYLDLYKKINEIEYKNVRKNIILQSIGFGIFYYYFKPSIYLIFLFLFLFLFFKLMFKNYSKNNSKYFFFFYGTLKKGFHWNQKYLSRSKFIGNAITNKNYPLVVGESYVPYLCHLPETGKYVKGEVWEIDHETLVGLDEYEGVNKGYYERKLIDVLVDSKIVCVYAYFKSNVSSLDLKLSDFLDEYSLDSHLKFYSPIKHIQVKQQLYLGLFQNKF
jgi:gamma-glutamylcyclotransferase (GGCT)/AIG2-like uncharacterized protein YtfP